MKNGISPELMDDALIMDFLINEVPFTVTGTNVEMLATAPFHQH